MIQNLCLIGLSCCALFGSGFMVSQNGRMLRHALLRFAGGLVFIVTTTFLLLRYGT